ncbi:hypothetical protein ABSL23_00405 (plasmid) [Halobacterium sp. NMX12-1]|uniref:Uncharacterized protein n=1 Tax=Halobacterium sp. NMX12-1 TaxID=3166650 RepID=A0AAU8C8N1_9EURY
MSLENGVEKYTALAEMSREHVELDESLGDFATTQLLRELVVDVEADNTELEHYLKYDSLAFESATE